MGKHLSYRLLEFEPGKAGSKMRVTNLYLLPSMPFEFILFLLSRYCCPCIKIWQKGTYIYLAQCLETTKFFYPICFNPTSNDEGNSKIKGRAFGTLSLTLNLPTLFVYLLTVSDRQDRLEIFRRKKE
jgi:hypothetical protein